MKFPSFSRIDKNALSAWWWTVDRPLFFSILGLMGLGVALVMAASSAVATRIDVDSLHFVIRHLVFLLPSIGLLIGVSMLQEKQIWRLATVILGGCAVMMILVLLVGTEIKGAQRWLHLPGFSLQPSEIMKPVFAIFTAWLLVRQQEQPLFPGMILAVVCYGVFATLLILQPDFGMTFVLTCMIAAQIFLAGLPFRILVGIILIGMMSIILAYNVLGHVQHRIDRFLDPEAGDNYQIDKSIEAFQYGGLWGTGPGQGMVKNKIPDAHADFIFSVGAEEGGFIFVVLLLALYAYIIYRVLRHLLQSQHMFVILACGGLLMMFTLQTLIHMGSALHLIPTKGMTLPFISYGGTSLLSMGLSFGVILALTRRRGMGTSTRMGLSAREPERNVS